MKSAMQTLAQVEGNNAIHMEIIATTRTLDQSGEGTRNTDQNKPDTEHDERFGIRVGHLQGDPDGGQIDNNKTP